MATIPRDEISFHPGSTGTDPDARLFEWRGGLYRGVRAANEAAYRRLAGSDAYARAVERGLAASATATEHEADGFPLVLAHERLPVVSYPMEWPWPMLKDAGLALLDLNLELVEAGYLTKDPSSWNVVFDGTRPVYVDFTNLWTLDRVAYAFDTWPEWFRSYYTYPLRLVAEGKGRVVRRLLRDYDRGIVFDEYLDLGLHARERLLTQARRAERRLRRKLGRAGGGGDWRRALERLRDELESVDVPIPVTKWSKYYDRSLSPAAPVEGLTAKHRNVEAVVDELGPASLTDIGPATGWFSKLAAGKGVRVVGLEADESAASRLYVDARERTLPIVPLVMDITRPTSEYGLLGRVASASDRLGGELVLALALVHHLVHGGGLDLGQVAQTLAPFAQRHLLVEMLEVASIKLQFGVTQVHVRKNLVLFK